MVSSVAERGELSVWRGGGTGFILSGFQCGRERRIVCMERRGYWLYSEWFPVWQREENLTVWRGGGTGSILSGFQCGRERRIVCMERRGYWLYSE